MTARGGPVALRSAREILADQYDAEGRRSTAAAVRRGGNPSESVLRSLRAIEIAQREAIATRAQLAVKPGKAPRREQRS
jgi:hypothetical protein